MKEICFYWMSFQHIKCVVNDVVVAVANVVAVAILLLLVTFHVAMTSILTIVAISRFSLL